MTAAIRRSYSRSPDPSQAVAEFHAGVAQPEMALVVFVCSSKYDLDSVAAEMNRRFAGVPVVGCTTAGEIGPDGYQEHSLVGASFPAADFNVVVDRLGSLQSFDIRAGHAFAQVLLRRLEAQVGAEGVLRNSFALMLIDGLSIREEPVAATFQDGLGAIPLVGGSAGDDLALKQTFVFHDGAFHQDSVVLCLVNTACRFKTFKTQHFAPTEERLVVTEADTARRVVREINGLPATEEYARLIGASAGSLHPGHFAASPVVVLIDGADYVRAIQKSNEDGSLTFFCAIEEGLVLRVARGQGLVEDLERTFAGLEREVGSIQLTFACDCILRRLESNEKGLNEPVGALFRRYNAIGFSTYGEQISGVHVNQTLTGVVIGTRAGPSP